MIAQALQQYYARHAAFPLAGGIQSLCTYVDLDAGCSLTEVLDPLPSDPSNGKAYYYVSNGQSFYLFAETEAPAGPSQCEGAPSTPQFPPDHLYCVHGTPPGGGATPTPAATLTP